MWTLNKIMHFDTDTIEGLDRARAENHPVSWCHTRDELTVWLDLYAGCAQFDLPTDVIQCADGCLNRSEFFAFGCPLDQHGPEPHREGHVVSDGSRLICLENISEYGKDGDDRVERKITSKR